MKVGGECMPISDVVSCYATLVTYVLPIALFCGLVFIVIGLKFIGVPLQIYGVYEFFKAYAIKFLSYFEFIPVIGPYITRMRQSASLKKNDDANKV